MFVPKQSEQIMLPWNISTQPNIKQQIKATMETCTVIAPMGLRCGASLPRKAASSSTTSTVENAATIHPHAPSQARSSGASSTGPRCSKMQLQSSNPETPASALTHLNPTSTDSIRANIITPRHQNVFPYHHRTETSPRSGRRRRNSTAYLLHAQVHRQWNHEEGSGGRLPLRRLWHLFHAVLRLAAPRAGRRAGGRGRGRR